MPLDISIIEKTLRSKLPHSPETDSIISHVQEAIRGHLLTHELTPRGIFQMRIATESELSEKLTPKEHTYLVLNFGPKKLPKWYLPLLRATYGDVIFLRLKLNHSIILS